jgi:hypothetical protein
MRTRGDEMLELRQRVGRQHDRLLDRRPCGRLFPAHLPLCGGELPQWSLIEPDEPTAARHGARDHRPEAQPPVHRGRTAT